MDALTQKGEVVAQALVYECLNKILSSTLFDKSPRQQELLRYLVKETLAGNAERLKGYTLGVEIFGRSADFDPASDAIVRVEMGRLRTKLREYYLADGKAEAVHFELPKGSYGLDIIVNAVDSAQKPQAESIATAWQNAYTREIALAVLPFANLSPQSEQNHFVDGVVDNLIYELSRLSGLLVISRQSSFRYRDTQKSPKEIATELGVKYLLEGSVQMSGQRVRVTVKLVDANTEAHVWSERFEGILQEIFSLQDEITLSIVKVLQVKLTPIEAELFGQEGTESIAAHDALLRGMVCHWRYAPVYVREAREHFERAVELDPNYSAAHAWLSRTLLFLWVMRWEFDETLKHRALDHAKKAVEINDKSSYALSMLGWAHLWHKHQNESIAYCREAVATDPNNAEAQVFLSMALSCAGLGTEGLFYIEKVHRLNPHSSPHNQFVHGLAYYVLEDYDKAIIAWKRGCAMSDTFPPNYLYLCTTYALLGMEKEMLEAKERYLAIVGGEQNRLVEPPWTNEKADALYLQLMQKIGLISAERANELRSR